VAKKKKKRTLASAARGKTIAFRPSFMGKKNQKKKYKTFSRGAFSKQMGGKLGNSGAFGAFYRPLSKSRKVL